MTQPHNNGNGQASDSPEATLISVILDRSGSMNAVWEPTIAGFNEFLHEQQKLAGGGRGLMSLTQFDERYEVNFVGEPIENVPDLDTQSYVPRGSTALFDAIGRTVHDLETWTREHDWKERVLVLIITDGHENASTEYDFRAVRVLIEQKEKDGWNFAYMGANQDSYAVAGSLNIRPDFIANYDATASGTAANYKRMAASTGAYRTAKAKGAAAPSFFKPADDPNATAAGGGKLRPKSGHGAAASEGRSKSQSGRVKNLKNWFSGRAEDEPGH